MSAQAFLERGELLVHLGRNLGAAELEPLGDERQFAPPLFRIDGQRCLLTGPVTVIGRGSEADIVVDDPGVSRRHLEIRITPDGVVATDLGSTNGLFVEGHQVPAATLLDGNSLTIGRTRIMFWTGSAPHDAQDR